MCVRVGDVCMGVGVYMHVCFCVILIPIAMLRRGESSMY